MCDRGDAMAKGDDLLHTIETVHAAALDEALWPVALKATAQLLGGAGATLEVFAPPSQVPVAFHSFGIPPAGELDYFEHYAALSPRAAFAFGNRTDALLCDYLFIDEPAMDRDPFYAKLLPQADFRYYLAGKLFHTPQSLGAVSVHRTRTQGHIGASETALMKRLIPHFRQAFDTAMRLRRTDDLGRSLEGALDWLADGVALLAQDGTILHANEAMQAIARHCDGISITKRAPAFATSEARSRFAAALAAIARVATGDTDSGALQDFSAARPSNAPSYLVSLRPLVPLHRRTHSRAVAILFVRDPASRRTAAIRLLRTTFGFTEAEASLAQALQAGRSSSDYASDRAISLNTAYTHLRRVKEKTGCRRITELIRKLNDLHVPLRIV